MNRNPVPMLAPGIGNRIRAVADLVGDRKEAAGAAGVSVASLQRYIAEEVEPTFSAMAGLARAAGVDMEWLATGEGAMRTQVSVAPLDRGVLREVLQAVEELLDEVDGDLAPEKKAELIELIYEEVRGQEGKVDRARILKLVKLAS